MVARDANQARDKALAILAGREHTRYELTVKLQSRQFSKEIIDEVIFSLEESGLLSDARAAEMYIRQRAAKGYGEHSIRAGLYQKGVDGDRINQYLQAIELDWLGIARGVFEKKFAGGVAEDKKTQMKQTRFLAGRGFSSEIIGKLLQQQHEY